MEQTAYFSDTGLQAAQFKPLTLFGQVLKLSQQRIAFAFVVIGILWMLLTWLVLDQLRPSMLSHTVLHLVSGLSYVVLTAVSLYLLIHQYTRDLSCSRELTARVFELSPGGIAVVRRADKRIILVNRRFEAITGYSREHLLGRTAAELDLWQNSSEQLTLDNRLRHEDTVQGYEATFRRSDGSLFPGTVAARQFSYNGEACTIAFVEDTSRQQEIARKVEELTRFDAATGLPNQKLLTERLQQLLAIAGREQQGLAVLFLALGRCPGSLNALKHDGCDELLRCVTVRLRSALRETDTLAVLQQGEFGILLPKAGSERELLPVVNKLLGCIHEPISIAEAEFQLHVHIGIALFPGDGRTAELLQQHAQLALNNARTHEAESCFHFYAEEMNQLAGEQMQIESSILKGIRAGEFFACYQPVFDRTGKQLAGMEALARWQHSSLGLLGPDKFIPVAESNGTIVALGDRILELALQNCKYWREHGHPNLTVAVNVSVRQLKDRKFAERVARQLQLAGLPAAALCCELTESMLMEHVRDTTEQIYLLKDLGVTLAIDDFGTGYSSLTYLKHLPVDYLKIDRSFVRDLDTNPDDRAIVTAILAMARSLHIKVVAEGVETARQQQLLQELGCDYLQGYHLGTPMKREEFTTFLQGGQLQLLPEAEAPNREQELNETTAGEFEQERQLQYVSDITLKIAPLQPSDRLNTVLDRFQTDKALQVLPVVEQERVAGILNRSEFIEDQVVGRIGYAFHINHSKKVRDLMRPVPLVIDSEASIEEAARIMHGNFGSMRLENICVARRGIYQGVLDVRTLVEAITALNLKLAKGANPLTGLPGNESIQRETTRRLEAGLPFDIAYIDIDHFKPYNDFYGFERGDMVIQVVGDILRRLTEADLQGSTPRSFCGHIGGDDFIIITCGGRAAALCRQVIREFETRLPVLHGSSDCAKGCYTSFNRKGELETFSLLSLSAAIISTGKLQVSSYAQLASMASEVKKSAKKIKGSSIALKDSEDSPGVTPCAASVES